MSISNDQFVANVRSADQSYEGITNSAFTTQAQTLASNMTASDAQFLAAWQSSFSSTNIPTASTAVASLITNYYANTLLPQKDAQVTNFATQIRARNAQLVQQFSQSGNETPDDIARITGKLESIAEASITQYDTQLTTNLNSRRDAALTKASDPTVGMNILADFSTTFTNASNAAVAAFLADMTAKNTIFAQVLNIADVQFANDLTNTLANANPPLTDDQRQALVTTRDGDRAQIVTWRQQLLNDTYTAANATRTTQNTALTTKFNSYDLTTLIMKGLSVADFFNS